VQNIAMAILEGQVDSEPLQELLAVLALEHEKRTAQPGDTENEGVGKQGDRLEGLCLVETAGFHPDGILDLVNDLAKEECREVCMAIVLKLLHANHLVPHLCRAGLLRALLTLVTSACADEERARAIAAVQALLVADAETRSVLQDAGAIPILVQLLASRSDLVRAQAAHLLCTLAVDDETCGTMVGWGAIGILTSPLPCPPPSTSLDPCEPSGAQDAPSPSPPAIPPQRPSESLSDSEALLLMVLARSRPEQVIDSGGFNMLLHILDSKNPELQAGVLEMLVWLAERESDDGSEDVLLASIEPVLSVLRRHLARLTVAHAAAAAATSSVAQPPVPINSTSTPSSSAAPTAPTPARRGVARSRSWDGSVRDGDGIWASGITAELSTHIMSLCLCLLSPLASEPHRRHNLVTAGAVDLALSLVELIHEDKLRIVALNILRDLSSESSALAALSHPTAVASLCALVRSAPDPKVSMLASALLSSVAPSLPQPAL